VSAYWREQYETRSAMFWHEFYKRNTDNFYKDRHYIHIVFPELQPAPDRSEPVHLLEVGSGVGNAVLPLLEIHPSLHVYAIDIARSAIDILRLVNSFTNYIFISLTFSMVCM
jgi:methyltransferase-like protein 6